MTDLIVYEEKTVLEAFLEPKGLSVVIDEVRDLVDNFDHDLTTDKGRKKTITFAANISKFKGKMDDLGKDLVSEWKTKSKAVDAHRKEMKDTLDELKIAARKPVTEWEAEQIKIATEKLAAEKAEELRKEIENDWEFAELMDQKFDRDKADSLAKEQEEARIAAEKDEQERLEIEEQIRKEAIKQARVEAEKKAKAELERVEREKQQALEREQKLKDDAAQAELDRIAAEKQVKVDAENAEKRRLQSVEQATQDEINRQKEQKACEQEELEEREADKKNVDAVMGKAKEALMVAAQIDEKTASWVTVAIKNGEIPSISIKF